MADNNVRKASFNLGRIKPTSIQEEDYTIKKSSYTCPAALQQKMKRLSVDRQVKLNELIIEAFNDILSKYGQQ